MDVSDFAVTVRAKDLSAVGQILDQDLVDVLVLPRANNVGSWEFSLPDTVIGEDGIERPHELCQALRTPGAGIIVSGPGGVILSGPMTSARMKRSASDPSKRWYFTGVSDVAVLARDEAEPDPMHPTGEAATANDVREGAAETVIREYVSFNIGPDARPERQNPNLTLAADHARGDFVRRSPRFTNLLELVQDIATASDLLFDIVQVGDKLELRVTEVPDLTAEIRLDIDNDQLESLDAGYSVPGVTVVNVLGQDRGTNRQVVTRTSAEAEEAAALWGVRIQRTIDQRQTDDLGELAQAGDKELAEEGRTLTSSQAVPLESLPMVPLVDWNVGARVTAIVGELPVTTQVAEMPLSISADGVIVTASLGDPADFDWESLIDARVSATESKVARLERNTETSADSAASPNLIINGDFRINQRNWVSGSNIAQGAYFLDRWYYAGAAASTSTITFTGGDYGRVVTINTPTVNPRIIAQKIERASIPAGDYILSWEGTAAGRVYKEGSAPGAWSDAPVLFTADGAADYVIELSNVNTAYATVSNVQVIAGSMVYPYQRRSVAEELMLCQRYFQRVYGDTSTTMELAILNATSTTFATGHMKLGVPLRAAPTLRYSSLSHLGVRVTGTQAPTGVSISVPAAGVIDRVMFAISVAGSLANGQTATFTITPASAGSRWIELDAEL